MSGAPGTEAQIDVVVETAAWDAALEDPVASCVKAAHAALAAIEAPGGVEVSVLLADDARITALNAAHRGKAKPTNVLSWPSLTFEEPLVRRADWERLTPDVRAAIFLGDVALALETIRAEAEFDGKTLEAHAAHLIVHGTLHLCGYDHHEDAAAARMEALEADVLEGLGISDPYCAKPTRL